MSEARRDLLTLGPESSTGKGSQLGQRADLFIAGLVHGHQKKPAAVQPAAPLHQCCSH